ncbi:Cef1 [Kluyveromyces lactis]|nr:Cef1 [Kluyveromyces lactis]
MAPVPIYVKGGIWTNLEDQILKAAVQKYGTHAWSKVASLLQKKNARQCQSRWNEFLNPSLNFKPFSQQEDDKLLDLAKRIPNQWRSIGEMMGRPAQTCIDRYNILLAIDKDDLELAATTGVQIGEINPNNESLPAKADKDELLDEEREMLAEARARLLNTQGKKATRKIRERMLEESKRVAFLQKRRELKQAGVDSKIKAPRKKYSSQMDYNEDIAYEQQPLPGIYDTSKEDEQTEKLLKSFEKLVERKGLLDRKSDEKKTIPQKRRQGEQITSSVTKLDSVLTDEYKKPKLELAPATVKGSKRKINKTTSILHLFESLPSPKNDFEIVLDDSDEEMESNDAFSTESSYVNGKHPLEAGISSTKHQPENETLEIMEYIPTVFQIKTELQVPSSIVDPKNEIDRELNRIISAKENGNPIYNSKEVNNYLEEIINSASITEVPSTILHPKLETSLKTITPATEHELVGMERKVHELRTALEDSVKSHREAVSQLSQDFQEKLHPTVSGLAYQYYTDYMKYRNDHKTMQEETQSLAEQIKLVQSSQ